MDEALSKRQVESQPSESVAPSTQGETAEQRHEKFVSILKRVLPQLGQNTEKIIQAQVMLTLKIEGLIGKELSEDDMSLVQLIKDSILESEDKTQDALSVAQRIMKDSQ